MVRTLTSTSFVVLLSCGAFGQAVASKPEFDVADIKLNKGGAPDESGGVLPGGQFSARNVTMSELLRFAYNVRENYITGGPSWFESDHFDITGKASPNTSNDTLRIMMQTFLAKQFKLTMHQEQKPMEVFALVVGKGGPKAALQNAASSGRPDCQRRPTPDMQIQAICTNMTMADLAKGLQGLAGGYVNQEVVDQTGLAGAYDLTLTWVGRANIDNGGLTMFDALDKQLGLRLEERRLPMPIIVIDHVEKLSDN
jgi:uncharacterized protein (TIGR03435 family)